MNNTPKFLRHIKEVIAGSKKYGINAYYLSVGMPYGIRLLNTRMKNKKIELLLLGHKGKFWMELRHPLDKFYAN